MGMIGMNSPAGAMGLHMPQNTGMRQVAQPAHQQVPWLNLTPPSSGQAPGVPDVLAQTPDPDPKPKGDPSGGYSPNTLNTPSLPDPSQIGQGYFSGLPTSYDPSSMNLLPMPGTSGQILPSYDPSALMMGGGSGSFIPSASGATAAATPVADSAAAGGAAAGGGLSSLISSLLGFF